MTLTVRASKNLDRKIMIPPSSARHPHRWVSFVL
jgi:hypothetical protein